MSDAYASLETTAFGRTLDFSVNREHLNVRAVMYAANDTGRNYMLVYATADLSNKRSVRLTAATEGDRACIWIEHAAFELTEDEYEQFAELLDEFSADSEAPQ